MLPPRWSDLGRGLFLNKEGEEKVTRSPDPSPHRAADGGDIDRMEMGEGHKKRGAARKVSSSGVRMARNWMLCMFAFLLIANPEGGNQSSGSGMCLAEQVSRKSPPRLAGRSSSRGGVGLLPALSKGSKKKHAVLSQDDDTARRRPSPLGGSLGGEEDEEEDEDEEEMPEDFLGDSSYYGEEDEAAVDVLEEELYGTKHRIHALPGKALKTQSSKGKEREPAANSRRYIEDSEERKGSREYPSVSSDAVDEIERQLHSSEMNLGEVVHRGGSKPHGGDGRGHRRAIERGKGREHRECREDVVDDDENNSDEKYDGEGVG